MIIKSNSEAHLGTEATSLVLLAPHQTSQCHCSVSDVCPKAGHLYVPFIPHWCDPLAYTDSSN